MTRRIWQLLVVGLVLLVAALLQVGLLATLPIPGATPDLVLVVVAAMGLARGPSAGALAGAGGGLLLDLVPPATGAAGQWMLVLVLVGWTCGRLAELDVGQPVRLGAVGVVAGLASAAYLGISALLGPPTTLGHAAELVGTAALYTLVLAAAVVPAASWLFDRTAEPTRTAW